MTRVLVVEDTLDIAMGIREILEGEGFVVSLALTGAAALEDCEIWHPDLIVLDLMLPVIDGYAVLRRLRETGRNMPVLILSAKHDEVAKVEGFRVGADDYVTKPFGRRELVARLRALARRAPAGSAAPSVFSSGGVRIVIPARRVMVDGVEVALRPKEFVLLLTFIAQPEVVLTREALLDRVWHYEPGVTSRTVDWHIAELRRKIGDSAQTRIVTVRKLGYRWSGVVTSE